VAVWEFDRSASLFAEGFELAQRYLDAHPELTAPMPKRRARWWRRLWSGGRSVRIG
jgi:hypothetical protein